MNEKVIVMAANTKQRNNGNQDYYMNPIRDYIGACFETEDVIIVECYENYRFKPEKAREKVEECESNGVENIYLVAITGDPVPTDWLDSDNPEPTTGKIEDKETVRYEPFSENGHMISKGEIKNEKESLLKYFQVSLGDRARVIRLHCGDIFDYSEEVKKLQDAVKSDLSLAWNGIPATYMQTLVDKGSEDAVSKEVRDWYFSRNAHAATWGPDVVICPHEDCKTPFRWHEESNWKYSIKEYEDVEETEFRYKDWNQYPVMECPICHKPLTRLDQVKAQELADEARAEAWELIENSLAEENKRTAYKAALKDRADQMGKHNTKVVTRLHR